MRVLAGQLKSRLLFYPKTKIRPTTELVRAAIFNMIGDRIIQAKVADFFAGAGSLGIEALSRGAKIVYFFEKSVPAIKYLLKNLDSLDGGVIEKGDVFSKIKKFKGKSFDIIIADPPYQKGLINKFINCVINNEILISNGIIVLQHHKKDEIICPEQLTIVRQKRYGDTIVTMLTRR